MKKIYKIVDGEQVALKASEIKNFIMKINNWNAAQYQKEYDIFKNKLRTLENFEGVPKAERESPVELLYKQAKAKKRYGSDYQPSLKFQRIISTSAYSSSPKRQRRLLKNHRYVEKLQKRYEETTFKAFKGLIEKNPTAKEIVDKIKDPVQREKALIDLSDALRARINEQGVVTDLGGIPFGETFGSPDAIEFDLTPYL